MTIRILESPADLEAYDTWVRAHPQGSLWQSTKWKTYQESLGKKVRIYAYYSDNSTIDSAALVVIDKTVGGFSTWDIPRGPLVNEERKVKSEKYAEEFVQTIIDAAKKERCFALYISPSFFTFPACPAGRHFSFFTASSRHIQPEATRILDLTQSENDLLTQMHPKGRYNIALAKKHGVIVETRNSEKDIDAFYELLKGTGGRDGFTIAQKSHYTRFLSSLRGSYLLQAKHQGKLISGLIGVEWNGTAIYYYGASSYEHRSLMAPYLLQWEALRRAKAHGCTRYDLLGISPEDAAVDDPWKGITDFKRKFGGAVVTYPPEKMMILRPLIHTALAWKRALVG